MSSSVEHILQVLGLLVGLTSGVIFLTGKDSLRKFSLIAAMSVKAQRWTIGIISVLLLALSIAIVLFSSGDKIKSRIVNYYPRKPNVIPDKPLIHKVRSVRTLSTDIRIMMRVDNERNDVFSGSLADFYRERGYNATVGYTKGMSAANSIVGDLSSTVKEEGMAGTQHYTNYKVTLALKVYKGDGSVPCTDRIYEKTMTLSANGSKETLLEQAFGELLNKIKSESTPPVCL